MKEEHDFSNAEQGKFYLPAENIQIPIYLDRDVIQQSRWAEKRCPPGSTHPTRIFRDCMMEKYKDLQFKKNRNDLSADLVSNVFLIKVYSKYQRHNEWIRRGDTDLVISQSRLFDLSLQATKDSVENQRTQGTVFMIDDTPALCVTGRKYTLIIAHLYADSPFRYCDFSNIEMPISLWDIHTKLRISKECSASAIYTGKHEDLVPVKNNEIYYSRTSKSTGSKEIPLGWSLKQRNINCERLFQFMKKLEPQRR